MRNSLIWVTSLFCVTLGIMLIVAMSSDVSYPFVARGFFYLVGFYPLVVGLVMSYASYKRGGEEE